MATFITIGNGDAAGYDRVSDERKATAHAHDDALRAAGALIGIAGRPVQVREPGELRRADQARGVPAIGATDRRLRGFRGRRSGSGDQAGEPNTWCRRARRRRGVAVGGLSYQAFQCVRLLGGQALGRPEVGALGVGDRKQPALAVLVVGDAEHVSHLLLAVTEQVQRGPARTQSAGAQRQAETPDRGKQRRPERHSAQRLLVFPTEDAGDHQHGRLMHVLGEIGRRIADQAHPLAAGVTLGVFGSRVTRGRPRAWDR